MIVSNCGILAVLAKQNDPFQAVNHELIFRQLVIAMEDNQRASSFSVLNQGITQVYFPGDHFADNDIFI